MPFRERLSRIREGIGRKSADKRQLEAISSKSSASSTLTLPSESRQHATDVAKPGRQEPAPAAVVLHSDSGLVQPPRYSTFDTTVGSSRLPGQLWRKAYEAVKRDKPKLVDVYEMLLCRELGEEANATDQKQLNQIVWKGLEKTSKGASFREKVSGGLQLMTSLRRLVDSSVQHTAEEAAVWGGVCLLLQVSCCSFQKGRANSNYYRCLKTRSSKRMRIAKGCLMLSQG